MTAVALEKAPPSARRQEITSLTGLRGLSAVAIIVVHTAAVTGVHVGGALLVDLFFMLSGFVLSYVYLDGLGSGRMTWPRFTRMRFARLYPMYIAVVCAMGAIATAKIALGIGAPPWFTPLNAVREFALLSALPLVGGIVLWNAPAWSVVVEWWVNFTLFPLLVLFGHHLRGRAVLVAGALVAFGCAFALIAFDLADMRMQRGWAALLRGFEGFSLGYIVYRIWSDDLLRLTGRAGAAVAWLTLAMIYVAPALSDRHQWIVIPLLPLLTLFLVQGSGLLLTIFNSRVAVFLGEISYSLYLIHMPVLNVVRALHVDRFLDSTILLVLCVEAITIPIATVTYLLIERRMRTLLQGRGRARPLVPHPA